MELPTEFSEPIEDLSGMITMVYGDPKIGKSTLASTFPKTLFIATEEGLRFLRVIKQPCTNWVMFKDIVKELRKAESKARFRTNAIDTVDNLYKMCQDYVCETKGIAHPSDEDWGKGWEFVRDEFHRGMQALTSEGYGVLFISHTKTIERNVRGKKVPSVVPSLTNQARRVILPLVDFMFYLSMDVDAEEQIHSPRKLYCRNTLAFECGSRQAYFPESVDDLSYDGIMEAIRYAKKTESEMRHG